MMRRGIIAMDLVIGILILTVLTIALASAAGMQGRALSRVKHACEALRIAERTLVELQSRTQVTGETVSITLLESAGAPPGWRWVRVEAQHKSGTAQLVGLVPATGSEAEP